MKRLLCVFLALSAWLSLPAAARAEVVLSEFMASNTRTLLDEDGESSDWIELQNLGAEPVNLLDWALTDDPGDLRKWRFPATNLASGAFLVVFASGKDRRTPGAPLHTSFNLSAGGEYLALVHPDGLTIATEFAPVYPPQVGDVSFGFGLDNTNYALVRADALARVRVPADGSLGLLWTLPDYDDAAWIAGLNGVGFDTGALDPEEDSFANALGALAPLAWFRFSESAGTVATNLGTLGAAVNGSYAGGLALAQPGPRPPAFGGLETDNTAPRLNGSTGRVIVPDNAAFDLGTGPFTIALWFNGTNVATRGDLFTYKGSGGDFGIHVASVTPNTISVYHNTFVGTGGALANNTWYFLVFTRDGAGQAAAWLNGVRIFTGTDVQTMNIANDLVLGANHSGTPTTVSIPFNGFIDEVAIFNRVIPTNDIARLQQLAAGAGGGGLRYADLIQTDVQSVMAGQNSSAYIRIPFVVDDVSRVDRLNLRVRYDDGFVAYLNGQEAASANAAETNSWNASATARHPDGAAVNFVDFDVADARAALLPGTNILAIHGLNISAGNPDFFIQAELVATTFGARSSEPRYFLLPTPGTLNGIGSGDVGPVIGSVDTIPALPARPADADDLIVTARVAPAFAPLASVTLRWRVMFGVTNSTAMFDDGQHHDGGLGDGVFGAVIPATASTNGQMIRYYVVAADTLGRTSRWPLFEDPLGSPEYLGTVVTNPGLTSALPIWEWFAADVANAHTTTGTRGAVFFQGRFYDNVRIRRRGAATTNGQKFDFLRGFRCFMTDELADLDEVNVNNEASDGSFIRPPMAYESFRVAGNAACQSFNLLLRVNGGPDRVGIFVEQVDERLLARYGRDPQGALYKFVQRGALSPIFTDPNDGVEKKTRLNEDRSDLAALCAALALSNSAPARLNFIMDNLDLPALMTHLACRSVTMDSDDVRKNIYMYRDTRGNGEWTILPWDKDWTFGVLGDGGTFLQNPFFGDQAHAKQNGNQWSLLYNAVFTEPKLSAMYLRRLRTVMDQQLQPPGTLPANGYFEQRIEYWFPQVFPHVGTGPSNVVYGAGGIRAFLQTRRTDLYVSFAATNLNAAANNRLVPIGQLPNVTIEFGEIEYNPASGNQAEEYVQLVNPNPFAVDVSGWRLDGAVRHTFRPGTVLLANSALYASPDVVAFRARSSGPRGGQGLFVQGNYSGSLSARGETLLLYDDRGRLVRTNQYQGNPSLAQSYLRITELMYHPAPLAGNTNDAEAFEFIELRNTSSSSALSLAGVRLANGVEFAFSQGAVPTLAPGASVLVVKNLAAFRARYGDGPAVAGEYTGSLENRGERLQLLDAAGEEILDFSYDNQWYPITDGFGFSLVVVDEQAEPDAWGRRAQWRASGVPGGSPALADPAPPAIVPVLISEALTRSDVPPPSDSIELYNPSTSPAPIGGWFLSDDFNTPKKFRIPDGVTIAPGAFLVFDESQFNPGGTGFALGSDGDEVWLFSAAPGGELTGYYHGFRFGAAEDGVSFGRYVTSIGEEHFVAQTARTLNAANAGPRVGPVVIGELQYHPVDRADGSDSRSDEYVELANLSGAPVPLFDPLQPANTWALRGGISYAFPPAETLAAGGYLLVVGFDPSTNAAFTLAFRSRQAIPDDVALRGPWSGKLDNSSDVVELTKPTTPLPAGVPRVLVDRVAYRQDGFWPAAADGTGASLQRLDPAAYGDDPANWLAAAPTPGAPRHSSGQPPAILLQPEGGTFVATANVRLQVSVSGTPPLYYQWRRSGANLPGATNATLELNNLQIGQAGDYEVLVYNRAGSAVSSQATVRVIYAAFIVQQPAPVKLRGSTNNADYGFTTNQASFNVAAVGTGPVTYQWRFNGMILPGQTAPTLTLSNVGLADDGDYDVAITDDIGTILSAPAHLTVLVAPTMVQPPLDQMIVSNGTFSASAIVRGNPPPFRFEWREVSTIRASHTNAVPTDFFTSARLTNLAARTWRLVVFNEANAAPGLLGQFTVTTLADTDGDGLPDVYEAANGLDTNDVSDAQGDLDLDGMKNRDEYLAGTDPKDPASLLRVQQSVTSGKVVVEVGAVANRTYSVQYTDNPGSGPWFKLADVVARPANRVESVPDPGWTTNRFYRLVTPVQ